MNDMNRMVGQMMWMPFTVFASTLEAFGRSMSSGGWMGEATKAIACAPCEVAKPVVEAVGEERCDRKWECDDRCGEGLSCPSDRYDQDRGWWHRDRCDSRDRDEWCGRCGRRSCDCGCGSDRGSDVVKLVEYSLVNVQRGHDREGRPNSRILDSGERLVTDCTDLEEFRNEVIVEYARTHRDVDGKRLRVYTKVLRCWCKDDVDWCEEQVDALQDIAHSLRRDREPS